MGHQKHQIRILKGCLLIWITISMAFAGDSVTQTPTGDPIETTAETSTGAPAENRAAETSAQTPAETPAETPTQTPAETPAQTPAETVTETPADTVTETSTGAPAENRADMSTMGSTDMMAISQVLGEQQPTTIDPLIVSLIDSSMENNCHVFQCMGDNCYKNQSAVMDSANTTCNSYCEMFRHNTSYYEARCNEHCVHHICNSMEQENCSVHCCNSSTCFNTADNNMNATTHMPEAPTTTTTTAAPTTATTIAYSDKKCRSFSCSGPDCFKNQATVAAKQCRVGINHCELQKKVTSGGVSYEGGCSNTCATSSKSCATITTADCFQECCNATNTGCCMKLDGQVHFNNAPHINKGSAFKLFACAFIVLSLSRYFSFLTI